VGVPDDRFGERVTAVLSYKEGEDHPSDAQMTEWMHGRIAGYKIPRTIIAVPVVQRAANGKADYKWAKATAKDLAQAS